MYLSTFTYPHTASTNRIDSLHFKELESGSCAIVLGCCHTCLNFQATPLLTNVVSRDIAMYCDLYHLSVKAWKSHSARDGCFEGCSAICSLNKNCSRPLQAAVTLHKVQCSAAVKKITPCTTDGFVEAKLLGELGAFKQATGKEKVSHLSWRLVQD